MEHTMGGAIPGPGGEDDTIPLLLSDGFVIPTRVIRYAEGVTPAEVLEQLLPEPSEE